MENLPSVPKPDLDLQLPNLDISTPSFVKDALNKVNDTFNQANKEIERLEVQGMPLRPGLQKVREGLNEGIKGVTDGKKEGEKHLMEKVHMFEDVFHHSDKIFADFNEIRKTYPFATAVGGVGLFTLARGVRGFFLGSLVVGSSAAYFNYYDRQVLKQLQAKR